MDLFTIENLLTLLMLTLLQAVLGFDNLLYISLESQRVEKSKQAKLRRLGIGLAVVLRLVLLYVLMKLIQYFQEPIFAFNWQGVTQGEFNVHALIVLFGGVFIMYTAMKEIWHMLSLEDTMHEKAQPQSFNKVLTMVVIMSIAILISSGLMIWMADRVAEFLQKNRMYEVLGLFVLFIVGIMLLSEGGHLAHLKFFGFPITPMSKTTFYFILAILVIVEVVQSKYSNKLSRLKIEERQD